MLRVRMGEGLACVFIGLLLIGSVAVQTAGRPAPSSLAIHLSEALPGPRPDLSPAEVVRLQLAALQYNDAPYENAGIETAFRFASPANQRAVGTIDKFALIFLNPLYRPLVNHLDAQLGDMQMTDEQARQAVMLTMPDGKRAAYVFTLIRQHHAPFADCWMIDGVLRVDLKNSPSSKALRI